MILLVGLVFANPRTELSAFVGGSAHIGLRATTVRVGPGLRIRQERGVYAANFALSVGPGVTSRLGVGVDLGTDVSWPLGVYRPAIGLEVATHWGRQLRGIDSDSGLGPYRAPFVLALRIRLSPFVLRTDRWSARLLSVSAGPGVGAWGGSYGVDILEIAHRL